jgi:hypothetical protein
MRAHLKSNILTWKKSTNVTSQTDVKESGVGNSILHR